MEPNLVRIGKSCVTVTAVEAAIEHYGSTKTYQNHGKKRRSLGAMNSKFRFIKTEGHLRKLVKFEKEGKMPIDRRSNLNYITSELVKAIELKISKGENPTNTDIENFVKTIIKDKNVLINLEITKSWIMRWRKQNNMLIRDVAAKIENTKKK